MSLNDVAALHNLVTVVDAAAVFEQLATMDSLTDRGWNDVDGDKRTVAHLLCDQLEFADLLLLNKCDLVSEAQLGAVEAFLRKSNPTAEVCPRLRRPRHRRPIRRPLQHRRRVSRSRLSTLSRPPRRRPRRSASPPDGAFSSVAAAQVVRTEHSVLPPKALLGTARFSMHKAEQHPQWLVEAREHEHTPETLEYARLVETAVALA